MAFIRFPAERLLLSVVDANPDLGMDVGSASWMRRREVRLKKAMGALFGSAASAKGQQSVSDQKPLWWMASERYRDRFFEQVSSGTHPLFPPGSTSYENYMKKMGENFKFRSDRTLVDQATERYFGPFNGKTDYDLKRSHSERLRKKWRKQREFWNWDVLYNDYVDESIESVQLEQCWDLLAKLVD